MSLDRETLLGVAQLLALVVLLSLVISAVTAALVYLSLHWLFVRPMRRMTESILHFRADPVDGARLMNAVIASGVSAATWASTVDSIWMDFTKGLGCPIGAVLAGDKAFIEKARRVKHIVGGAMRQAGIAAAGCLYALDHHIERLQLDHAHAKKLAAGIA